MALCESVEKKFFHKKYEVLFLQDIIILHLLESREYNTRLFSWLPIHWTNDETINWLMSWKCITNNFDNELMFNLLLPLKYKYFLLVSILKFILNLVSSGFELLIQLYRQTRTSFWQNSALCPVFKIFSLSPIYQHMTIIGWIRLSKDCGHGK